MIHVTITACTPRHWCDGWGRYWDVNWHVEPRPARSFYIRIAGFEMTVA
jgi:hypothetical protein